MQYTARGDNSDTLNITLDDCIKRALDNDSSKSKMDVTIGSLNRQLNSMSQSKSQFLDNLHRYKELFGMNLNADEAKARLDKGEITVDQYNEILEEMNEMNMLLQYFTGQGIQDPERLNDDDYFIVRKFDFPMYEIENQIEDIQNNIEAEKVSQKGNIRNLYDSILSLEDDINLSNQLYNKKVEDYNKTLGDFKRGSISESTRYQAKIELDESKLNLNIKDRNLQNLLNDMKSRIGVSFKINLNLTPFEIKEDTGSLSDCEVYVNKALSSRAEILNARNDLVLKAMEFNIIKQYILDSGNPDYISGYDAVLEKNAEYGNVESSITKDINSKYSDAVSKQKALNTAKFKENSAEKDYREIQKKYEMGYLSRSTLLDAENLYLKAGSDSKKALRSLDEAMFSLELSSGTLNN